MRIYTLQIHKVGASEELDKVFHYEEFRCVKSEFKRQLDLLRKGCKGGPCSSIVTEPYIDDENDGISTYGEFEFTDDTTNVKTIGKVYDYDVM